MHRTVAEWLALTAMVQALKDRQGWESAARPRGAGTLKCAGSLSCTITLPRAYANSRRRDASPPPAVPCAAAGGHLLHVQDTLTSGPHSRGGRGCSPCVVHEGQRPSAHSSLAPPLPLPLMLSGHAPLAPPPHLKGHIPCCVRPPPLPALAWHRVHTRQTTPLLSPTHRRKRWLAAPPRWS